MIVLPNIIIEKILSYLVSSKYLSFRYRASLASINKSAFELVKYLFTNSVTRSFGVIHQHMLSDMKIPNSEYHLLKSIQKIRMKEVSNENLLVTSQHFKNVHSIELDQKCDSILLLHLHLFPCLRDLRLVCGNGIYHKSRDYNSLLDLDAHGVAPPLMKLTLFIDIENVPLILVALKYVRKTLKYLDLTLSKLGYFQDTLEDSCIDLVRYFEEDIQKNRFEYLNIIRNSIPRLSIVSKEAYYNQLESLKIYRSRVFYQITKIDVDIIDFCNVLSVVDIHYEPSNEILNQFLLIPNHKPNLKKIKLTKRPHPPSTTTKVDIKWSTFIYVQTLNLKSDIESIRGMLEANYHCKSIRYLSLTTNTTDPHDFNLFHPNPIKEFNEFLHQNQTIEKLSILLDTDKSPIHIDELFIALSKQSTLRFLKIRDFSDHLMNIGAYKQLALSKSIEIISIKQSDTTYKVFTKIPNFSIVNVNNSLLHRHYMYGRDQINNFIENNRNPSIFSKLKASIIKKFK
ncbi:hypothetical protein DLAC_11518 [Tieghemostelium lacteum]|uniref:F-box domain-containing protein n=1 Tax=Tieghemostelium lacteum TaxID=361077 RepID=A0A152A4G1_TIELA|nr:hypothetical protein DLAC_11518 [Tieghemostelium lacteum]|eukprot:KYR01133.1 hypothetical protein DLAC_11518 [Tieghemostelium lacteum]